MNFKNTLKSSVAVAALFAFAAPVTVAADDTLSSGNKNSLKMSGQIVKAISHMDDGTSSGTFFTDGDWTLSRIRWVASGKLSPDVTVGGTIEMDIPISNPASSPTLGSMNSGGTSNANTLDWNIRHQYVYAGSKSMGKVYLGQTSGAADGSGEASYSGTGIFSNSEGASFGSTVFFNDVSTASAPANSTVTPSAAINNLDHSGRTDLIRYDTPSFMGAKLKVSVQPEGDWETGLAYNEKIEGMKLRVRAGYSGHSTHATKRHTMTASVAVEMDGINASISGGKINYGNPDAGKSDTTQAFDTNFDGIQDPQFIHIGLGYNAKMFGVGGTAFSFGWNRTQDKVQLANHDENEGESLAIRAVQNFSSVGSSVGLEYVNYSFESKSNKAVNSFDDIDVVTLLTVFKF